MRAQEKQLRFALALALVLAFACKPSAPLPPKPPPVVARVDGAPIYLPALQREVTRVRASEETPDGGPSQSSSSPVEIARAVLAPLVDRQILLSRAQAEGLTVSDADVQRSVDALAADTRKAGQTFNERLALDGETTAVLHEETKERLLAEQAIARDLHIALPTQADIKAWADAHKTELAQPDEVHAAQILVASPEDAKSLLDQLRAGAKFDVLAREHSLSPDARAGGDLGFFPKGVMPPPFDEVCFALKPGRLSGVVRSSYGFHIFKLLERRAARRKTVEEMTQVIGARILRERQSTAEAALLAQLRQKAQIQIDESVLAQIQ